MRDIFTVFGFTLRDGLRKKAFVVTTVIVLVVIVLACALVGLFGGGQEPGGQPSPGEKTDICYYIDENGLIPGAVEALNAAFGQINFVSASPSEREARLDEVEADSSKSVVEVLPGTPLPSFRPRKRLRPCAARPTRPGTPPAGLPRSPASMQACWRARG